MKCWNNGFGCTACCKNIFPGFHAYTYEIIGDPNLKNDISSHPPLQCHANVIEELIQAVTNKLDELQGDEPRVVGRLEGLQTSVKRLEQTTLTGV